MPTVEPHCYYCQDAETSTHCSECVEWSQFVATPEAKVQPVKFQRVPIEEA